MAEYLTNTTDLTKVASAIRTKGGTTDSLIYPDGFVTAIQAIQSGVWCGSVTPVSDASTLFVSPVVGDELYNAVKGNKVIGIALETGNTEDETYRCLGGGGITNANNREIDIGVYRYNGYSSYSNSSSRNFSPRANMDSGVYFGGGNTTFSYKAGKTFIWVIATIDVGVTE